MSVKPLRQIAPLDFSADQDAFFAALRKIAGENAIDCGVGNLSVPCVRKSWAEKLTFTATRDVQRVNCPSLVGYASDKEGSVFRVTSCPDRNHKKGKVLEPTVELCESFSPPNRQLGDSVCSVLDFI